MPKMTKEEKELLQAVDRGEWKPTRRLKTETRRYSGYARETFQKNKRINIRISSKDLEGVQKKAMEEGLPYQTLIASVIHKYVSNTLTTRH
jgi:predicted DNA binding CopG/RHH family protein